MQEATITQVHNTTPEEFKEALLADLKTELQLFCKNFQPIQQPTYLTREEVAEILKISMSTISEWNRKGILNPYRLGNTIRYKSNELDKVLIKINK
jgi:excisionase family DNA binding protein